MMLDRGLVAASPATVYRVLKAAGRLDRIARAPSKKQLSSLSSDLGVGAPPSFGRVKGERAPRGASGAP
jgi:hypothetical protein